MEEMPKHRFDLLLMAISFMTKKEKTRNLYLKYAKQVHSQIALIEHTEGRPLQMADWLHMAMTLGKQALKQDIGARQIAESIYPVLDGSGQHLARYAYIPAGPATSFLLKRTGLSASLDPELTDLLVRIIAELQRISLTASSTNTQPA
jgi:hypothetical protein